MKNFTVDKVYQGYRIEGTSTYVEVDSCKEGVNKAIGIKNRIEDQLKNEVANIPEASLEEVKMGFEVNAVPTTDKYRLVYSITATISIDDEYLPKISDIFNEIID